MRATVSGPVITRIIDATTNELVAPIYVSVTTGGQGLSWQIPAGYRTDFASVPRITAWLIPRTGAYSPAAVAHDYLITDAIPEGRITSRQVDRALREIMRWLGVPGPRRWLMWAAVRWAAAFNRARRAGWWRDLPAMLGVTVLAAPLILPGVAGVLISQVLIWLVMLPVPREHRADAQKT